LQSCCQQLRTHLAKRNALRDGKERQSRLLKYVPDVGRAVFGLLDAMRQRKTGDGMFHVDEPPSASTAAANKNKKNNNKQSQEQEDKTVPSDMIFPESSTAASKVISQQTLQESLTRAVTIQNKVLLDDDDGDDDDDGNGSTLRKSTSSSHHSPKKKSKAEPAFLKPVFIDLDDLDPSCILDHPGFTLRLFQAPRTVVLAD
jgi:hypothetical protein